MTATYGTIGTLSYTSRTNSTIPAPASIANGNLLLLFHLTAASGTAPTQTLPAGFTLIGSAITGGDGSFAYRFVSAYKVASGESGDYVVTHATASSAGAVVRVTGSGTLSVDAQSQAGGGVNTGMGTVTATSVTTTVANDLLFYAALNWNVPAALTPPTGMTERLDAAIVYLATETIVSAGATGTRTQSTPGSPWFASLIAIKDVAAAAGKPAKVWSGSAWVTKPVKVWSGSAWVTKPVKVWNGSAWV